MHGGMQVDDGAVHGDAEHGQLLCTSELARKRILNRDFRTFVQGMRACLLLIPL